MIEFKPRFFVLPAIALTVLAMLHAPANGGRAGECGPAVQIADPGIRASFARRSAASRRPPIRSARCTPTIRCADKRAPHQAVNPNTKEKSDAFHGDRQGDQG